jgi:hypothetical protein
MGMDASLALRVRDRWLIKLAVEGQYSEHSLRIASWAPPKEYIQALVEGFWLPKEGSTDKEAFLDILKGVKKLLALLQNAPGRAWEAISHAFGLHDMEGLSFGEKVKLFASRVKALAKEGREALQKLGKKIKETFPLSIYFLEKHKAPSLTDLMVRIAKKSPRIWAIIEKIKGGAEKVDKWLNKYLPTLKRPLLAAIFILVWFQVAEISWDLESLVNGFSGGISFTELLTSLPESGVGLILSMMGLGYGALPITIILRIMWLVANHYLEWVPGKGLRVRWEQMGVQEPDELVTTV